MPIPKKKKARGRPKEYGDMTRFTLVYPKTLKIKIKEFADQRDMTENELMRRILILGIMAIEGIPDEHQNKITEILNDEPEGPDRYERIKERIKKETEQYTQRVEEKNKELRGK